MRLRKLPTTAIVSLYSSEIVTFMRRWPASGLKGLNRLRFEFDRKNGDLIGAECNGRDCRRFDGEALRALSDDAQAFAVAEGALPGRLR